MNKLLFLICILIGGVAAAQTNLDDQAINLKNFTGKKLLYVVMPDKSDTSLLNQIQRFQQKYSEKVQVIALVTPNGNRLSFKTSLSKIADSGAVLSEGIKSRRANSPERESIMEWITEKRMSSAESAEKRIRLQIFY